MPIHNQISVIYLDVKPFKFSKSCALLEVDLNLNLVRCFCVGVIGQNKNCPQRLLMKVLLILFFFFLFFIWGQSDLKFGVGIN